MSSNEEQTQETPAKVTTDENVEKPMQEKEKTDRPMYPLDEAILNKSFVYHPPKPELKQPERYVEIRTWAKRTAEAIMMNVPPSRERSLALTNLEQAMFWANAGIARNE